VEDVDLNATLENLEGEIGEPMWAYKSANDFEIEIPSLMEEKKNLNPTAEIQYGYTERMENEIKENYIIVLMDEFETAPADGTILKYAEASLDTLMAGKESFDLLNEPKVEDVNGISMVAQEVNATIMMSDTSVLDIFYVMGVYQGKKAYYQVVSWTIANQRDDFAKDMRRMVYSFKEL
jgi:hypothetical protein